MVNLISLEKAAKAYAHRSLLDGVSLGVSAGDRIGVVGRNGAGKSTLLRMLAGRVAPDTGRVATASGLRLGYLPQADQLAGSVGEIVFGPMGGTAGRFAVGLAVAGSALELDGPDIPRAPYIPQAPWEADPRARAIMAELLPGIGVDAQAGQLSGGERRRVALAALLVAEQDVLLLDEPTNHLDIEAIDWLGRHLRDRAGNEHCAVIVVSHDRWLLDTVCERTWEIDRGQVHSAEGGYSAYVLAQAERERSEDAAERRRRNLARKELAWLQRGARARTTKAKFRVEAANTLIASEPPPRDSVELTRLATARLGKTVIELEDVSVSVGTGDRERSLLDQVTWRLGPGDRVGIVGVNGSGKTSLLTVLAGGVDSGSASPGLHADGTVIRGKTVRLAHLSQELAELDPDQRVRAAVEEIRLRIRVGDRELSAGQLLERLGFTAERQRTRVGDLSGGERRRVQMLRLLMDEPNVLLLDEPTNDLDIETLTEFEDLLDDWPGTLVVVSHDRYFLERVTEHVVALLGDGKLAFLGGGVDEYLDRVRAARAGGAPGGPVPARAAAARAAAARAATARAAPARAPAGTAPARTAPAGTAPARTAAAGAPGASPVAGTEPPRTSAAQERTARKELQRLERQLERLSARETELTAQLAANATDYEKLTTLGADLKAAQAEKADLEDRWLTVAAELEQ